MTPASTALAVTNLRGGYAPGDEIVRGVDLHVPPGHLSCVVGPNGAGKSTVLRLLAGLGHRATGQVTLAEHDLTLLSPQARAAAGLVFVPQERNVFATLGVEENLRLGAHHLRGPALGTRLAAAYDRFPQLRTRRRTPAGALSGGQRQLLAVAAALMSDPRALLLDEPTAGLAPGPAAALLADVQALARSGLAVLMVEQNATAALAASDTATVMVDGQVARTGPAATVAADPEIRRLFLGTPNPKPGPAA